jgi:hypothetical protein
VTRHTRYTTAVIASLAVALAACGGNDADVEPIAEPTPTETAAPTEEPQPDEPTETEEPEPDDPFAIPDEIDEAYVQSVLDELFAVRSEALRLSVAANGETTIPEEAQPLIPAVHSGPLLARALENFEQIVRAENIDEAFLPPSEMGDERLVVFRIFESGDNCIVVTGNYDQSETARVPLPEGSLSLVSLTRAPDDVDSALNPTPWRLHDETMLVVGDEPATEAQVAEASYEDFDGLITDGCEGTR